MRLGGWATPSQWGWPHTSPSSRRGPGAEWGGREGASAPSQPTNNFLTTDKIFFNRLVAHPKPTIRGIDITSGGKQ
jgi:hypothetical protein